MNVLLTLSRHLSLLLLEIFLLVLVYLLGRRISSVRRRLISRSSSSSDLRSYNK